MKRDVHFWRFLQAIESALLSFPLINIAGTFLKVYKLHHKKTETSFAMSTMLNPSPIYAFGIRMNSGPLLTLNGSVLPFAPLLRIRKNAAIWHLMLLPTLSGRIKTHGPRLQHNHFMQLTNAHWLSTMRERARAHCYVMSHLLLCVHMVQQFQMEISKKKTKETLQKVLKSKMFEVLVFCCKLHKNLMINEHVMLKLRGKTHAN